MITETAFYSVLVSEELNTGRHSLPTRPCPSSEVPRIPGIGDALAATRTLLAQRVDEACEVIETVLTDPSTEPALFGGLPPASRSGESLPEYAHFLLRTYLDRFMSVVFNGEQSIRLAVSGKRLKKVSRRLHDAVEEFTVRFEVVGELAKSLAAEYPGHAAKTYERVAAAMLVLAAWDASHLSPTAERTRSLLRSVERDGKIRLALFVCPPVDFTRISGSHPELYLRDHMHGSVLSRLAGRLRDLFRGLEGTGVEFELRTLIGDTDEDDYLWHGVPAPVNLDRVVLDARREQLIAAVESYLTEEVPGSPGTHPRVVRKGTVVVRRLSAMAPSTECQDVCASVLAAPFDHFRQRDIQAEVAIMRGLWRPGSYYEGLPEPDDKTLADVVVRKFATYAMQGRLLREVDPDLVLVQTERPPLLRSRMLNVGWNETGRSPLPTVDFFEPEDE